jgi:RNA polymerase sigma-70 factor (ECF subfamily)
MVASTDLTDLELDEARAREARDGGAPRRPLTEVEFRAIYDAHFKLVWSALRRLGVRDADVLDVTQKVFITAYTKYAAFQGRSRLTTWLFGICQKLASDYRRSAPIRREIATDATEIDTREMASEGSVAALATRRRAALAETILDKLPDAQRTVFVLFELEELSGAEIADIVQVSVGTVRSRLRLARETFAREVKRLEASELASKERT